MKSCYPLEIEFEYNEELHSITPVLLQDEHDTILIDCGYPGFTNHLQHAVARHGMSLHSLTKIIVTHHDIDHIGSLAALSRLHPDVSVTVHEREAPYIDGSKNLYGLSRLNQRFVHCRRMQSLMQNSSSARFNQSNRLQFTGQLLTASRCLGAEAFAL